ncbi:exonuclease [Microbacterium phage Hortus1]|nr:exonuclease [Microbacterium phage Hortus1]AWY05638.1 exonuclease [Microbacterium phage OlinDD]AWY05891.1 exonuclease [Microbacterium phage Pioneer3]AWY06397.1 exonuclease [Microbacterium phage Tandem]
MASEKWSKAPKLSLWSGEGDGQGRTYVDPTDGDSRWPSVTTVLKHEPKDLTQWAATKVAEKARDFPEIVLGDPDLVVIKLQYAHNEFRDERAEVGTGVHAWQQAQHEGTWDYPDLDDEQVAMTERLEEFFEDYQVRVIWVERTIRGDGFMGTADMLAEVTDPLTGETFIVLIDIKTSKNLWETNDMQLAALGHGLYSLVEVPEGTEGAFKRKGKTKKDDSWWVREEAPKWDMLAKLHIREDFYELVPVDPRLIELHYEKFLRYVDIQDIEQRKKEALK